MSKKRRFAAAVLWCLTVAWAVFIFIMSAKSSQESGALSGRIIRQALALFVPDLDSMGEQQLAELVSGLQFFVRKAAHLTEFAVLGSLLCGALRLTAKGRQTVTWAFLIGALYAVSDEIHQLFVPGRACQITDMLIDSAGVLLGVLFVWAALRIIERIKAKSKKK